MQNDESARREVLRRYRILDTPAEPNFDRITALATTIFGLPACTLSLADDDRHWFKSRQGVADTQMPRRSSFCNETILGDDVFVVEDALADPRFASAPVVVGPPHLRFYAGAPLVTPSGARIGSLCVLDTKPMDGFAANQRLILSELAATCVELLEARAKQLELRALTDEVAHLARHDPLTGLANRRRLREVVDDLADWQPSQTCAALLYIDLDGFKAVNDQHGHPYGDNVLREVAVRLRGEVADQGKVARLGGDEFAVFLVGDHKLHRQATRLAEGLIACLSQPFAVEGSSVRIGASIGLAVMKTDTPLDVLLKVADQAVYKAKATGRGRLVEGEAAEPAERSLEMRLAGTAAAQGGAGGRRPLRWFRNQDQRTPYSGVGALNPTRETL